MVECKAMRRLRVRFGGARAAPLHAGEYRVAIDPPPSVDVDNAPASSETAVGVLPHRS